MDTSIRRNTSVPSSDCSPFSSDSPTFSPLWSSASSSSSRSLSSFSAAKRHFPNPIALKATPRSSRSSKRRSFRRPLRNCLPFGARWRRRIHVSWSSPTVLPLAPSQLAFINLAFISFVTVYTVAITNSHAMGGFGLDSVGISTVTSAIAPTQLLIGRGR